MHQDQIGWLVAGALAVVCLVLLAVMVRGRRRVQHASAQHESALDDLRVRLDELEHDHQRLRDAGPATTPARPRTEADYVITGIPAEPTVADPRLADPTLADPTGSHEQVPIDGAAFADTLLRETVVKAASLAHGVRRGLAPATRNRIRFEMKQEVRRARRQRKADTKQALREKHARDRAMLAEEAEAS